MSKRILIVEDEPILFAKLERLLRDDYELYPFTKSVEDALDHIVEKRPDLVLLDIDLEGMFSGLDLGKKLSEDYSIPFIYVTQHGDLTTFTEGLNTGHEQFIVKTKPTLNKRELLNAIQTVLYRKKERKHIASKIGILVTDDYKENLKDANGKNAIRHAIDFDKIAFISTKRILSDTGKLIKVKKNYVAICTIGNDYHLYFGSIKELEECLPENFIRINEGEIINTKQLQGKVNGKSLYLHNEHFEIGRTYLKKVNECLERLFGK